MALKNTQKKETAEPKPAPVGKVRVGLITASIWENTTDKGQFYNTTFERRYKDGQGNWQSTHSYGESDLLELAKAADLAHTEIVNHRQAPQDETAAINNN